MALMSHVEYSQPVVYLDGKTSCLSKPLEEYGLRRITTTVNVK
jgi:hypothetical protein